MRSNRKLERVRRYPAKAQFQITTAGQWPPGELTTRVSLGK
jgi:hypothetical protein